MSKTIYQLEIEQEQLKYCHLLSSIVNDYYSLLKGYYRGYQDLTEQELMRECIVLIERVQSNPREISLAILENKKEELLNHLKEISNFSQSFVDVLNAYLSSEIIKYIECYYDLINIRYSLMIEYYLMSFNDDDIRRARDLVSEKDYFSRNVANITSNNEKLSILLNKKDELLQRIKDIIDMPIGILHA